MSFKFLVSYNPINPDDFKADKFALRAPQHSPVSDDFPMVTNLSNPDDTYMKPTFARNIKCCLLLRKDRQNLPKGTKTLPKGSQLIPKSDLPNFRKSDTLFKTVRVALLQDGNPTPFSATLPP